MSAHTLQRLPGDHTGIGILETTSSTSQLLCFLYSNLCTSICLRAADLTALLCRQVDSTAISILHAQEGELMTRNALSAETAHVKHVLPEQVCNGLTQVIDRTALKSRLPAWATEPQSDSFRAHIHTYIHTYILYMHSPHIHKMHISLLV
jgi:hypothetical protein